ncbi:helix-turn-helix transcriptional regulator [Niallia taxi]|uniref:helix-turn-helix domain-containing protein n=1 Tax=Niallia taxi TaxID=2499688 RepID=UPI003D2D798E
MNDLVRVIGERIKYFRLNKGYTQEKLAEIANIHSAYIGGVERAERNISLGTLNKITQALEIDAKDLFKPISETEQIINKDVLLTTHMNLLSSRSQEELILIHELVSNLVSILDKNQTNKE